MVHRYRGGKREGPIHVVLPRIVIENHVASEDGAVRIAALKSGSQEGAGVPVPSETLLQAKGELRDREVNAKVQIIRMGVHIQTRQELVPIGAECGPSRAVAARPLVSHKRRDTLSWPQRQLKSGKALRDVELVLALEVTLLEKGVGKEGHGIEIGHILVVEAEFIDSRLDGPHSSRIVGFASPAVHPQLEAIEKTVGIIRSEDGKLPGEELRSLP